MIYQQVNFARFAHAFKLAGRRDQFSLYGLKMLYDYLDDLYSDIGQRYELDVIALCCQYSELDKVNFLAEYDIEGIDTVEDLEQALINGDLENVIAYDLEENIILVDDSY